ncbi:MAG: DMT family transporter [Gammaproteobacteria bacterium]|nr:DMT family transporter [Gammaproteobacteria bacterium]
MFGNAWLLLTLAAISWGANAVAGRYAAEQMGPVMLTYLRWQFAVLVVGALAWPHLRADRARLSASWPQVLGLGALGFAGFNLALYWALHYTSAINSAIEQSGTPVMIMLLNYLLFRQRVGQVQLLGVMVTVAGVLITASRGSPAALMQADLNRGDAIMLIAVFCYASYAVALRKRPQMHWMSLLFGMSVGAWLATLPALALACLGGCALPRADGWLVVGFVVIFPTLMAQLFFMRGVELIGPNRAGLFINLVPIFAAGLAIVLLGETLHAYHVLGFALVLAGIGLAERYAPR